MYKRKRSFSRKGGKKRFKSGKSGWSYSGQGDASANGHRSTPGKRSLAVLPRSFNFPDAVRVKIKTHASFLFTSTSGAAQVYLINSNSIFEPFVNLGVTRGSPTAGNLSVLFQQYLVLGALLKAHWYPPVAASNTVGGAGALAVQTNGARTSAVVANFADFEELDRCTGQLMLPTITGYAGFQMRQRLYMDCAKATGLARPQYATIYGAYTDSAGAWTKPAAVYNPQHAIFYQSSDATTTTTYGCDLTLVQYVEFSQRFRA